VVSAASSVPATSLRGLARRAHANRPAHFDIDNDADRREAIAFDPRCYSSHVSRAAKSTGYLPALGLGDAVQRTTLRTLGGAIDSLVRSIRGATASDRVVAARVLAMWQASASVTLTIQPLRLMIGDVPAVDAGEHTGKWLLPCFMAGVKSIRLGEASADGLMALAIELSTLTATHDSVMRFVQWLGADGAEGFDIAVEQSFSDGGGLFDVGRARGMLATRTAAMSDGGALVATDDLDRAAARPELAVNLNLFVQGAQTRAFDITPEARVMLRGYVDDAGAWAEREIAAVLQHDALRALVPPARVARHLLERLQHGTEQLISIVHGIAHNPEPFHKEVTAAMVNGNLGDVLARGLPVDSDGAFAHALALLDVADAPTRAAFAQAFALREGNIVWQRVTTLGWSRYLSWLDVNKLSPDALAAISSHIHESPDDKAIRELMRMVPVDRWWSVLLALPVARWDSFAAEFKQSLRSQPSDAFLDAVAEKAPTMALDAWRDGQNAWNAKTTARVLKHIATSMQGRDVMTKLVRARTTAEPVRLAALTALAGHPELQAATTFRWSELLDPPELRTRLKAARKRERERHSQPRQTR
jgi:hypothetical protein